MRELGFHGDNYRWLDPYGLFPDREPEVPGRTDADVWEEHLDLMVGCDHYKMLWYPRIDLLWGVVQWRRAEDVLYKVHPRTITMRISAPDEEALANIEELSDLSPDVEFYIEPGNEPNDPTLQGSPELFAFIVQQVINETKLHVIFPGLMPGIHEREWYDNPDIRQVIAQCAAVGFHTYGEDRAAPTDFGKPIAVTEVGLPTREGRLNFLKQYMDATPGTFLMHHIFISAGQSNGAWPDEYILTRAEIEELQRYRKETNVSERVPRDLVIGTVYAAATNRFKSRWMRHAFFRQMRLESANFNDAVINGEQLGAAGEKWTPQVMMKWHTDCSDDALGSIDWAAKTMSAYADSFRGTMRERFALALAAYNAGYGTVEFAVDRHKSLWLLGVPSSTVGYVGKIMEN